MDDFCSFLLRIDGRNERTHVLILIWILAFLAFKFFGRSFFASLRFACVVAALGFALFVAQPVYRMEALGEKPGRAIANSKFLPLAAQFIPYLNGTNLLFSAPGAGTFAGPCVHYTHYQQKLMDLFGVPATALTGYGHSALRYREGNRTYVTDNGYWYKKIVEIGAGNWAPEGGEFLYVVEGSPNPLSPYLFPMGMGLMICLSYLLEIAIFSNRVAGAPFRREGKIKILPGMDEYSYRKSGNNVLIDRDSVSLTVPLAEVKALDDAPDLFFHKDIGHFQLIP